MLEKLTKSGILEIADEFVPGADRIIPFGPRESFFPVGIPYSLPATVYRIQDSRPFIKL